ncbi:hypothetical protein VPH35_118206 [Triticum aestivum]
MSTDGLELDGRGVADIAGWNCAVFPGFHECASSRDRQWRQSTGRWRWTEIRCALKPLAAGQGGSVVCPPSGVPVFHEYAGCRD